MVSFLNHQHISYFKGLLVTLLARLIKTDTCGVVVQKLLLICMTIRWPAFCCSCKKEMVWTNDEKANKPQALSCWRLQLR